MLFISEVIIRLMGGVYPCEFQVRGTGKALHLGSTSKTYTFFSERSFRGFLWNEMKLLSISSSHSSQSFLTSKKKGTRLIWNYIDWTSVVNVNFVYVGVLFLKVYFNILHCNKFPGFFPAGMTILATDDVFSVFCVPWLFWIMSKVINLLVQFSVAQGYMMVMLLSF